MGDISRNFSFSEFTSSATARVHGIDNSIPEELKPNLVALVRNVLQPLRTAWGQPLSINSGYRCPELNARPEIKGSKTSQHLRGQAADVACATPVNLAALAKRMGLPYDQMIIYPTFVHFSHTTERANRRQILVKQ